MAGTIRAIRVLVVVSLGCYDRTPKMGALNSKHFLLEAPEAGSPRSGCQHTWVLGEGPPPRSQAVPSHCDLMWRTERALAPSSAAKSQPGQFAMYPESVLISIWVALGKGPMEESILELNLER